MKYIISLNNFKIKKKLYTSFINENFLQTADLEDLQKRKKWHNNIDVTNEIRDSIGPISNHLKDVILILSLFPKHNINIHADGAGINPKNTYNVSINIPVLNCTEKTRTIFWDFPDERKIEYIHHEKLGTRQIVDQAQLVKKQEYTFKNTAVLFRNEYPHSVENDCEDLRLMLSWRFKPEYSWDNALELCKQFCLT